MCAAYFLRKHAGKAHAADVISRLFRECHDKNSLWTMEIKQAIIENAEWEPIEQVGVNLC